MRSIFQRMPGWLRIPLYLIIGLLLLALLGSRYESVARSKELNQAQPPGELVDVGGYRLHLVCLGDRTAEAPLVVLEAGAGGWSIHWYNLQQEIAAFTRVCSYDRAGFGWSDPGLAPRDGASIATDLHRLLIAAGESGPYLLVGASRGAQYARIFAHAHPNETAGLLLLDGEPEDFREKSGLARNLQTQNQMTFNVVGLFSRIGFFRLLGSDPNTAPEMPCVPFAVRYLPPETHAAYIAVEGQPKCFDALLAEEAATPQRQTQVRAAGSLKDLPLVVMTHGVAQEMPGASPEQAAETERIWQELQGQMAALSSHGQLEVASKSGHNIAQDQPELVISALKGLLAGR